jgi:hypothetical protein
MTYVEATIVIPLAVATALRNVAQKLDRNETDGMFITGLSATGNLPATHFVSSGKMPDVFIEAIKSPALLHTRAQAAFLAANVAYPYTLSQITAALSGCSISDGTRTVLIDTVPTVVSEGPHAFIARLGLKMIQGTP